MFNRKKRLSPAELAEMQELNRLCQSYAFVAQTIKQNTATLPHGKVEAAKYATIAQLLENRKQEYMAAVLGKYADVPNQSFHVDLRNGVLTPVIIKEEPTPQE